MRTDKRTEPLDLLVFLRILLSLLITAFVVYGGFQIYQELARCRGH